MGRRAVGTQRTAYPQLDVLGVTWPQHQTLLSLPDSLFPDPRGASPNTTSLQGHSRGLEGGFSLSLLAGLTAPNLSSRKDQTGQDEAWCGTHFIDQAGLRFREIHLPVPPECWDHSPAPPCQAEQVTVTLALPGLLEASSSYSPWCLITSILEGACLPRPKPELVPPHPDATSHYLARPVAWGQP